ncbi:MAG: glycosyltransferase family 4 protein [Candidatus Scalindua sp.]
MQNKKICILSSVHPVFDARIFFKEAKTLAAKGYHVVLIAQHDKEETVDGIRIIPLPKPKNRAERMTKVIWKLLTLALKQKADVYHFHDPELIPAGVILRLLGNKVIYDVHEDVPKQIMYKHWIRGTWLKKFVAAIVHIIEQAGVAVFTRIVAATPDIAKKFNPSRTVLIRNLSIVSLIDDIKPVEIEKQESIVIYAGCLTKIRGIKELVQAMEVVGGRAKLWLLGRWQDTEFQNECEQLPGWKYVTYMGQVPYGEHYSLIKSADMGLVNFLPEPNHEKSQPNKLFEYMACRLPMVVSNFAYWEEMFRGCAVFADPSSPEDIADKILYLLGNPDKAKQLGDRGRQLIEEKYSWENESKKLLKVYEELCTK